MSTAETPAESSVLGPQTAVATPTAPRSRSFVTGAVDPRTVPPWAVRELAGLREAALSGSPQQVLPAQPSRAPTEPNPLPVPAPGHPTLPPPAAEPAPVVNAGSAVIGVGDEDELDDHTVPRWAVEQLREQARGSGGGPH
jgi:hypothetical protein